jgi:crotonobetainyl-CoA:carnitine CoA-transferase CaiB-like acyl-CoA transferase
VQAATGMVTTNGGGEPKPMNFTANDYGTGLHLAVGIVLGLLARARGHAVTTVEASLMMTATVFQAEHVAQIAMGSAGRDDTTVGCHLYEAKDGWLVTCAVGADQEERMRAALGVDTWDTGSVGEVIATMTTEEARSRLAAARVGAAVSAHPRDVPDDPQVIAAGLLRSLRHPVAGRIEQVGVPLHLSVDVPAVKGPAPVPARR